MAQESNRTFSNDSASAVASSITFDPTAEALHPQLKALLDAIPQLTLIVDGKWRIEFANRAFLDFVGAKSVDELHGRYIGEALRCVNAAGGEPGQCGSFDHCLTCGVLKALLESPLQREKKSKGHESRLRIARNREEEACDFLTSAEPLKIEGELFQVLSFNDISDQKRRNVLERLFFHDILNSASGILGFLNHMATCGENNIHESIRHAQDIAKRLIAEIRAHRDLHEAERYSLEVKRDKFSTQTLLESVFWCIRGNDISKDLTIEVDRGCNDVEITTSQEILNRVLLNLVKNACEASKKGDSVNIGCKCSEERIEFFVHNNSSIEPEVQTQIFQRSFSTKGKGRGLGTYSVKLLTERYLGGKVGFISTPESGTTFTVSLPRCL